MKEQIEKALGEVDEIGHILMTKYQKQSKYIYAIVEGIQDKSYYSSFIYQHIPSDWYCHFIYTNKKKNKLSSKQKLINFCNSFNWKNYDKNQIITFLDKDLSLFINESLPKLNNLYLTDGYSVENSIISETTFIRTLSELCFFEELSANDIKKLLNVYSTQFELFFNKMIPLMSWMIHWQQSQQKPQLNNIEIKDIFSFKNGMASYLIVKDENKFFHKKTKLSSFDKTVNLTRISKAFTKDNNHKNFVRGKYLFDFFVALCKSIHNDYLHISNFKLKKRSQHHPKLDFIDIARVSSKPQTLNLFLKNTVETYVASLTA